MDNDKLIILVGVIVVAWVVLDIIGKTLQYRQTMSIAKSLGTAVEGALQNTKALDLIEPMATKVMPVAALDFLFKAGATAKTVLPDDWDIVIDKVEQWIKMATDGKPNDPVVSELAQTTRLALSKVMPPAPNAKG